MHRSKLQCRCGASGDDLLFSRQPLGKLKRTSDDKQPVERRASRVRVDCRKCSQFVAWLPRSPNNTERIAQNADRKLQLTLFKEKPE